MRFTDARATVLQLAREMAQSGRYRGWRTIKAHLRADGLPRVREVLDDAEIRRELDCDCQAAQPNVQRSSL